MGRFKFIYSMEPLDEYDGLYVASWHEAQRVFAQMPEEPRDYVVLKAYMPIISNNCTLAPYYLCKADNNGTTYIFSDYDLKNLDIEKEDKNYAETKWI